MTDRYIAVVVLVPHNALIDSYIEPLLLVRHIDRVEKIHPEKLLVLLDRPIRTDDFEVIENALITFGFIIDDKIVCDGSLLMDTRVALITARNDLIKQYEKKKPRFEFSGSLEQFITDLYAWSKMMDRIFEFDFEKE